MLPALSRGLGQSPTMPDGGKDKDMHLCGWCLWGRFIVRCEYGESWKYSPCNHVLHAGMVVATMMKDNPLDQDKESPRPSENRRG